MTNHHFAQSPSAGLRHGRRPQDQPTAWLRPGIGVKRWLIVLVIGIAGISGGAGSLLWRTLPQKGHAVNAAWFVLTLQFIPTPWHQLSYIVIGLLFVAVGFWKATASILSPYRRSGDRRPIGQVLAEHRQASSGPRVVALGGGAGMAILLRGLKRYSHNITAILNVPQQPLCEPCSAVRDSTLTRCLVALAAEEPAMAGLFGHRFQGGQHDGSSFGDSFVEALTEIHGSLDAALRAAKDVLALQGELMVAPKLLPPEVQPDDETLLRLLDCDLIVLGPGSFCRDVIPHLRKPQLLRAMRLSGAVKVYVCNLFTEPDGTQDFTVADFVRALHDEAGFHPCQYILAAKDTPDLSAGGGRDGQLFSTGSILTALPATRQRVAAAVLPAGLMLVEADIADVTDPGHHHLERLADALMRVYLQAASRWAAGPVLSAWL